MRLQVKRVTPDRVDEIEDRDSVRRLLSYLC